MISKFFITNRFLLVAIVLLLVTASCSTRKNTFTRRAYHNVTAHYNAYWNGNESVKEGVNELKKQAKDNYNTVLHINNYGTEKSAQSVNPNMDRAIEKASKVIQKHSMPFDKKEQVKWIMYSYLLIGKANFYKQDYNAARRAFDFVDRTYNYHPIKYEARLWLAKTYVQQELYEKAIAIFENLQNDAKTTLLPWQVRKEIPLVMADMHISREKYKLAREEIIKAQELNKNKKLNTRLNYILAQLYQKEGRDNTASQYFAKVLKSPASFEMAFNARINLARVYNVNSGNRQMIVRELEKMLKDNKNDDFQDQIYYALADIALKDKNDTLGIKNLRKSVATSVDNDYQKAISSLRLADLYYQRKDYRPAQAYYDTALMVIPADFPNADEITVRTEILTRLVDNLQTVYVQDSLQHLAAMPEAERLAIIDAAIAEYTRKEEEARRLEEEMRLADQAGAGLMGSRQMVDPTRGTTSLGGGGWYFYNPSAISMGYSEFTRKWGRRKLEDNWRLSNKREVNFEMTDMGTMPTDSTQGKDGKGKGSDMKSRDTYLKGLPFTPESVEASNAQIAEALFEGGIIYLEELFDKPKARELFTSLLTRFPENDNTLRTSYHLYRIYRDQGDSTNMQLYKNQIINGYPDSDYAKILIDPTYNAQLLAAQNRVKSLYEETYLAFERGQYRTAILYSNEAISNYQNAALIPRFAFLKAVSLGKTITTDTMKVELKQLIEDYPQSEVVEYARLILGEDAAGETAALNKPGEILSDSLKKAMDFSMYKFNPQATHFYALIVNGSEVNVYGTKVRITDFNTKNYSTENLQVNSVLLDDTRQMITISSFNELPKALRYFNGIKDDSYIFSGMREGSYDQFLISAENYPGFFKEKNTAAYQQFFKKNYLAE
ncbi:MAG: tetratricopeptide repeat protein [Lentimicrobium sp.]|nr:tetratricopeptide repeat protein [Lentimicrobium sp.]